MPRDDSTSVGVRAVTAVAPAKINLHLAVGDARDDGYHELVTVYRAVDLWEEVTVSLSDDDEVTVSGPGADQVPTDRTNLAARAVDLLREEAGSSVKLAIHINKGVPVAGGMAGGSADAAAALVATNRLLGLGLDRPSLEERAARLGSDIPFCVRGGTALGTGRGEQLATLMHARAEQHIVVALAAGGLSTPIVFAELDRMREDRQREGRDLPRVGPVEPLVEALAGRNPHTGEALAGRDPHTGETLAGRNPHTGEAQDPRVAAEHLGNDLEAPALSLMPALRQTLRAGVEAGALHAMVSGSGPTCLFFCASHDSALAVATEVSQDGVAREVRVTHGPVGGARVVDTPSSTPNAAGSPGTPSAPGAPGAPGVLTNFSVSPTRSSTTPTRK